MPFHRNEQQADTAARRRVGSSSSGGRREGPGWRDARSRLKTRRRTGSSPLERHGIRARAGNERYDRANALCIGARRRRHWSAKAVPAAWLSFLRDGITLLMARAVQRYCVEEEGTHVGQLTGHVGGRSDGCRNASQAIHAFLRRRRPKRHPPRSDGSRSVVTMAYRRQGPEVIPKSLPAPTLSRRDLVAGTQHSRSPAFPR